MAPPRRCTCGKASCFTCHRRIVNEQYRQTHGRRQDRSKNRSPEVSDAEMDRRALILMGRQP